MGRLTEARDAMHDFNTQAPQSAVALAREAELALTLDQIQSAKTLLDQAQGVDATHPYVIAVSGLVYLIDGHPQEAKIAFETALQRDPKDAKALFGLGLAEIKLGNFQAGQKKLQAANEADPGNALILTYLGRAQQQLGQPEAASASWYSAQQADPKDPIPWLYQAQAELQANRLLDARESLRQAQVRAAYRSVYRGDRLLKEDEQLLRANLAEVQRKLGLESLAFHNLSDSASEKNASNLRDQADVLQGQRFGESARRSLLLQSQFNDRPGNLPAELDIYGDGAGQTGASTPQHGVVSGLGSQQASYNNYDELFNRRTFTLQADATTGNQNTFGEQVRVGVGSDTLGFGIAQRKFKTDGNAPFENLDNVIWQGIVQWQPIKSTEVFVSYQSFDSHWGATFYPADPLWAGSIDMIEDNSQITRLGLRHTLTDDGSSELRGLWSHQQTNQAINAEFICNTLPNCDPFNPLPLPFPQYSQYGSSSALSEEFQYRHSGGNYATQWGVQLLRGQKVFWNAISSSIANDSLNAQQFYAAWQQMLNPYWELDAGLGWGKINDQDNLKFPSDHSTYLARWLPQLGVIYSPDAGTHVRLAAWQGMGVSGVGDATLAPTSLAGILLTRPSDNGQLIRAVAFGGDRQLSSAWLLTAETQQRRTDQPTTGNFGPMLSRQQVDESRLALHWQPQGTSVAVSLAYDDERIQHPPLFSGLDSVVEQHLRSQQLAMRWYANAQWEANLTWSHNQVAGTQLSFDAFFTPVWLAYQDRFNQADANLSWKFWLHGLLTAGVRNATDTHFQYRDIDTLNPRFSNGRLVYARLKLDL
jgi:Tfp pilus assembly protein PilF